MANEGVPAYGEDGPEAEAMHRAAAQPQPADPAASAKVPPIDAPVQAHGTTETDVAANLAERAARLEQNPFEWNHSNG